MEGEEEMVEVTMISAEGLENVRMFGGRMRTFALLFTNLDVNSSVSTRIDRDGGCNPVWNEKLQVRILGGLHVSYLNIQIYCMTSFGKKLVGWSKVPLSDITVGYGGPSGLHYLSYRLKTKDGKRCGTVNFSLRIKSCPRLFNPHFISKFPGQGSCQN